MTKEQELTLRERCDKFASRRIIPVDLYTTQEMATLIFDLQEANTALREENNKLYRERFDLYTTIAPKLGFKPFGKGQIKWALSEEDANAISLGESVFKYVEAALNQVRGE